MQKDKDDKYVAGYRFPMVFTTWNCGEWAEMTAKQKNAQASEDRHTDA